MRYRWRVLGVVLLMASAVLAPGALQANDTLTIGVSKAPVTPDGLAAGDPTDFVLTIIDDDPDIAGLTMYEGGTLQVTLPAAFVNGDPEADLAVAFLQGWPQSPILPFPEVAWDPSTNTITATAGFTQIPDPPDAPGVKQFHLLITSFVNPSAGLYSVDVEIQPDPASDHVLYGTATVPISAGVRASINPVSVINGEPPPPFPNSIHQTVALGEDPLPWGFYLWEPGGAPMVGLDVVTDDAGIWLVQDGAVVGQVSVSGPPFATYSVTTTGPSVEVAAAVSGIPTGLLIAQFTANSTGDYSINWKLLGGNNQTMHVTVE